MKRIMRRMENGFDFGANVIGTWFFGEVAFVVLPLLVILAIRSLLGVEVGDIFLLPDWSFASIVILASALNRFIEFKTQVQGDQSVRTYSGIRLIVLTLIAAVLVLALAVAHQHGVELNEHSLIAAQLILFFLALVLSLICICVPLALEWREDNLPDNISFHDLRRAVRRRLRDADRVASYIERAVRHWQGSRHWAKLLTEADEVSLRRLASLREVIVEAQAGHIPQKYPPSPIDERHETPNPGLKRTPDGAA